MRYLNYTLSHDLDFRAIEERLLGINLTVTEWRSAPASSEKPCFVIGDVHGRDDLFCCLIEAVEDIIRERHLAGALIITLGDYIDRGPAGLRVLCRVLDRAVVAPTGFVALPGNHEQFLVRLLNEDSDNGQELLEIWFDNGGTSVAKELGLDPDLALSKPGVLLREIRSYIGKERLAVLRSLPTHARCGDYVFVHAGIHPDVGLKMLTSNWHIGPRSWGEEDLDPLWIRGPFLTYQGRHEGGVVVVHGHTPNSDVEILSNRIGVDTRAYDSGTLSAVQLEGNMVRVIQSKGDARISPISIL